MPPHLCANGPLFPHLAEMGAARGHGHSKGLLPGLGDAHLVTQTCTTPAPGPQPPRGRRESCGCCRSPARWVCLRAPCEQATQRNGHQPHVDSEQIQEDWVQRGPGGSDLTLTRFQGPRCVS